MPVHLRGAQDSVSLEERQKTGARWNVRVTRSAPESTHFVTVRIHGHQLSHALEQCSYRYELLSKSLSLPDARQLHPSHAKSNL